MARHSLDVLYPGDFLSTDGDLQGEHIRLVSASISAAQPAHEFQVVRRLGTGSYAVVYLVKEVLYRPPIDDDPSVIGTLDLEPSQPIEYGGEYAIKCLSKENLDPDALAAQMAEVPVSLSLSFLHRSSVPAGHHPSVPPLPPQHRYPTSDVGDRLVSPPRPRIRPRRGPLLFSCPGPRSLRPSPR